MPAYSAAGLHIRCASAGAEEAWDRKSSADNKWACLQPDMCVFPGFFHLRVPESSAVGSAVGRIKAHDLDIGRNAEVEYTIVPGDGGNMFDITTNEHTQEGIIILKRVRSSSSRYTRVLSHAGVKYCTELDEYWIGTGRGRENTSTRDTIESHKEARTIKYFKPDRQ